VSLHPDVHVVPGLPEGEIISAFFWRTMNYGARYSMDSAYEALCKQKRGLDGMQSDLNSFHEAIGYMYKSIDAWIHEHTEYNFFCCGLPLPKFAEQFKRVQFKCKGPVRLCRLQPIFGVLEGRYRKCHECEKQQLIDEGFSFIHRRMGAPFVQYCSKHRLLLATFNSQMLLFDRCCEQLATPVQIDHDVELGKRIYHCICIPADHSGYHKDHVIEMLSEAGWLSETGRIHLAEFIQRFCNRFRGAFADARLDYLVQSAKYINDAIRSLLRADRGIHPIWCILFVWFTESEKRAIFISHKKVERVVAIPSREAIAAQLEQHRTLTAASKAMGIGMAKLTCLCNSYQIPFSARPKKYDDALVASINEAYDKGLRPSEVVHKFRISQTMAYRILRGRSDGFNPESEAVTLRTEDAKNQWLAALDRHPSLTYTALRKLYKGVWMQLYRKAPDWLNCRRPKATMPGRHIRRGTPQEILALLKSAIADAESTCGRRGKKPIRKSLYRLRELTGISESTQRSLQRHQLLEEFQETKLTFVTRRINWARRGSKSLHWKTWELAKRAGLRKQTVVEARARKNK
jgi:hypothetical protein